MKTFLKISEMMPYLPTALKDAIHHVAKDTGNATDSLELHRHTHSEKAKVNELDPTSRKSLAYVSYRTQDRDDEIVIPKSLKLDEFRKYSSVLVNHNYSLLPVGSDEWIDADDYGIKALTIHADTGVGTMANVVWDLVRQGHLKGRSVGFVPTSFTKPGARDWDHVANQLQSNWKEFDKGRAEKSVSRIITGGVLLEHSFVSVPCNTDAELIGVVKSMNLDGKIIKQLGLEDKPAEKVPSVCDECGYVAEAVPGNKCPECKTGSMKPKGKEKAIEVRVIDKGGPGSGSWEGPGNPRFAKDDVNNDGKHDGGAQHARDSNFGVGDKVKITGKVHGQGKTGIAVGFDRNGSFAMVRIGDEVYSYHNSDVSAADDEDDDEDNDEEKGFHSRAVEKPNPHMPGGSFSACVLIMEDKGHDSESAKKICGALQADAGGKGLTEAETKAVEEITGIRKAMGIPCTCDECGAEDECAPGSPCQEDGCEGVMRASKKMEKEYTPIVTVVKPSPQIKVLYVPPDADLIAKGVSDAVEKTLARRTGKIL